MTQVVINGNTYSDDGSASRDMRNGGHESWLLPMLSDTMVRVVSAESAATTATSASTTAQTYAAALNGTSSSSITIGTGSKNFTTQTNKQFSSGQHIRIVRTSDTSKYMDCQITSYNPSTGDLVVNVETINGSGGPYTDWTIFLGGKKGDTGATGAPGVDGTGIPSVTGNGKKLLAVNTAATAALWVTRPFSNFLPITSTQTFIPDSQVDNYFVIAVAGGGSGYQAVASSSRRGGQGGQTIMGFVTITSAQTVTIGSGGTGTSTSTGNAGADTSIGTILVAKGGIAGNTATPIYGGGTVPSGCIQINGEINISNNSGTAQGGGGSWLQGFVSGVASKYGAGGETANGSGSGGDGGDGIVLIMW